MKRIAITLIVTFAIAATIFAAPAAGADKGDRALVGTWVTTVAPPPEAEVPPFTLIFTFMEDHNLLATGTGGQFPALGNPCHGTWAKSGDKEYSITYVCLDFDATFQTTGMDKLSGRLTADGAGSLTGKIGLTNYDPAGQEVFSACCAAVEGGKLEVETLSETYGSRWRAAKPAQK